MTVLLIIAAALLMLAGLAGIILPILPGIPLTWLGLFIYAIGTGFREISVAVVVVFFVLTLLALALDFLAPLLGAGRQRASRMGILGAFLGLAVGIIVFGFWGIVLGPFLGALAGELIARRQTGLALRVALGTLIGLVAGTLFKVVLALTMLGFFVASFF